VTEWKRLNLNYKIVAQIDESLCIGCQLCHIACWDGAHQCTPYGPRDWACGRDMWRSMPGPREAGRERIVVTPILKLDSLDPPPHATWGRSRRPLERIPRVDETECVAAIFAPSVCPVDQCITIGRAAEAGRHRRHGRSARVRLSSARDRSDRGFARIQRLDSGKCWLRGEGSMGILIKGGTIVSASGSKVADVLIDVETIAAVGARIDATGHGKWMRLGCWCCQAASTSTHILTCRLAHGERGRL